MGLAILFLAAAAVWVVIGAWAVVWVMTHPPRRTAGRMVARGLPTDPVEAGATYSVDHIAAADGQEIELWLVDGDDSRPDGPVMVMLHGWGDSRLGKLLWLDVLKPSANKLVLFDLRAHGESRHGRCTWGAEEVDDVLRVIRRVREREGLQRPIVLVGLSMGTGTAIETAAACEEVAGLILDSPYRRPIDAVKATMRLNGVPTRPITDVAWMWLRWRLPSVARFDAAAWAAKLHQPMLILYGEDDRIVSRSDIEAIAASARATVVSFEAGHLQGACADPAAYRRAVAAFVRSKVGAAGLSDGGASRLGL